MKKLIIALLILIVLFGCVGVDNPAPQPEPTPEPDPEPNPTPTPEPSPVPSPTPEPQPTPNPQPSPEPKLKGKVEVVEGSLNYYYNSIKSLDVLAEFKNVGDIGIKFLEIKATWTNKNGERKSNAWLVKNEYVEPGEKVLFKTILSEVAEEPDIELEVLEFRDAPRYFKKSIELVESFGEPIGSYYKARGKVKNTSDKDYKLASLSIVYYNAEGKPVEWSTEPLLTFKAGEERFFSGVVSAYQPITRFEVSLDFSSLENKVE